jgi:hypothetical protein
MSNLYNHFNGNLNVVGNYYHNGTPLFYTGPDGPAGPIGGTNTQIIFNQSGNATGSSNLTYDYINNMVTLPNVTASSGSFSNLLLSSGNIKLG